MDRYNEYRYRKLFHCTHDEYLDTPYEDIEWMLHIDKTVAGAHSARDAPPVTAEAVMNPPTPRIM